MCSARALIPQFSTRETRQEDGQPGLQSETMSQTNKFQLVMLELGVLQMGSYDFYSSLASSDIVATNTSGPGVVTQLVGHWPACVVQNFGPSLQHPINWM